MWVCDYNIFKKVLLHVSSDRQFRTQRKPHIYNSCSKLNVHIKKVGEDDLGTNDQILLSSTEATLPFNPVSSMLFNEFVMGFYCEREEGKGTCGLSYLHQGWKEFLKFDV